MELQSWAGRQQEESRAGGSDSGGGTRGRSEVDVQGSVLLVRRREFLGLQGTSGAWESTHGVGVPEVLQEDALGSLGSAQGRGEVLPKV